MTTNLPKIQKIQKIMIENINQIKMALPRHLDSNRMVRIALTELRKNQKLQDCDPLSFVGSVMQAAQLGLEPGDGLGHAYLIPYKDKCTLQIGYKGLLELARRSGQIISMSSHEVYENDKFYFEYGLNEKLSHIPATENRGEIIAFYACAKMKHKAYQFEVMWVSDINNIRNRSVAYNSALKYQKTETPWITNYVEMGRKTVLKRLCKYLPVSVELLEAISLDEEAEAGIQNNTVIDISDNNSLIENKPDETSSEEKPLSKPEEVLSLIRKNLKGENENE